MMRECIFYNCQLKRVAGFWSCVLVAIAPFLPPLPSSFTAPLPPTSTSHLPPPSLQNPHSALDTRAMQSLLYTVHQTVHLSLQHIANPPKLLSRGSNTLPMHRNSFCAASDTKHNPSTHYCAPRWSERAGLVFSLVLRGSRHKRRNIWDPFLYGYPNRAFTCNLIGGMVTSKIVSQFFLKDFCLFVKHYAHGCAAAD